ncbi:hypothetical protein [Papillibacter cinnamivorans]|uniref:hypothetical protein n=1 Tax=Papillibacter cinnamivorans TaxID=100176 RepID=UPI00117F03C9|nr:hypothetical protein [Papillibacter cinnamivorans]
MNFRTSSFSFPQTQFGTKIKRKHRPSVQKNNAVKMIGRFAAECSLNADDTLLIHANAAKPAAMRYDGIGSLNLPRMTDPASLSNILPTKGIEPLLKAPDMKVFVR